MYASDTVSITHSCKRFQLKNEEDEDRKNKRVIQERQRTLDRLRTFKQVLYVLPINTSILYFVQLLSYVCLFLGVFHSVTLVR